MPCSIRVLRAGTATVLASPKRVTHYKPGGRKGEKRVPGENAYDSRPDIFGKDL